MSVVAMDDAGAGHGCRTRRQESEPGQNLPTEEFASGLLAQATLDALSANIAVIDASGAIVRTNKAWVDFARANDARFSPTPGEENYLLVCDRASGNCVGEATVIAAGIRQVLNGEQDFFALEYPCHSSTEQRWFIARVTGLAIAGRRHAVVAHENITARKLAEERLAESEERFRDFFELSPIGLSLVALDGSFLQTNRALCDIVGYEKEELEKLSFQKITHPTDRSLVFDNAQRLLDGDIASFRMEKRFTRKSGRPVWIQLTTSLLRDAQQRPLRFIAQIEDISERKRSQEEIERLAYYDTLTELPNRRLLLERLKGALFQGRRFRRSVAVMFLDLDRFKNINDTLGHAVGDELLKIVAIRLTASVRQGDTVSRQGGDEFVIVLSEIAEPRDAALVAEKIIAALAQPVVVGHHELRIGVSIGIAVYPIDGTDDAGELMKQADAAMYRVKESGRGHYLFFTEGPHG